MNITLSKEAACDEDPRYTILHGLIGYKITVRTPRVEHTGDFVGIDTVIGDDEAMELRIFANGHDYWVPLMDITEVVYL